MRIFVAGATGAMGKRLVRLLVANGHEVVGTTRSALRLRELEALGAKPVVLDVLENRELLVILDSLAHGARDYDGALARLAWLTWPKWLGLGAWFVVLSPELVRARGGLRVAAMAGSVGALTGVLAALHRGPVAEVMALAVAIGMVALVPGCLRRLPAPVSRS